jgi:hypothetical protein
MKKGIKLPQRATSPQGTSSQMFNKKYKGKFCPNQNVGNLIPNFYFWP